MGMAADDVTLVALRLLPVVGIVGMASRRIGETDDDRHALRQQLRGDATDECITVLQAGCSHLYGRIFDPIGRLDDAVP